MKEPKLPDSSVLKYLADACDRLAYAYPFHMISLTRFDMTDATWFGSNENPAFAARWGTKFHRRSVRFHIPFISISYANDFQEYPDDDGESSDNDDEESSSSDNDDDEDDDSDVSIVHIRSLCISYADWTVLIIFLWSRL